MARHASRSSVVQGLLAVGALAANSSQPLRRHGAEYHTWIESLPEGACPDQ